jgi:hypothetical protein
MSFTLQKNSNSNNLNIIFDSHLDLETFLSMVELAIELIKVQLNVAKDNDNSNLQLPIIPVYSEILNKSENKSFLKNKDNLTIIGNLDELLLIFDNAAWILGDSIKDDESEDELQNAVNIFKEITSKIKALKEEEV